LSIFAAGAFCSCVPAAGAAAFSLVSCAEAIPAPTMSAAAATVTKKVFLVVFFTAISNKL
jgi:hypothetical protein